jgi:hypothetical protein
MTQAERYTTTIRRLKHAGLLGLWNGIKSGNTPGWPPGIAFEYLVLRAFELEKAEVRYPYNVRLRSGIYEQIDGVIYAPGINAIVEAKDRGPLTVEPVAKMRNQLHRRPSGAIGIIFSRGGFTLPALALAQHLAPRTILLWPENEIDLALMKGKMLTGLTIKYRMAVEFGIPDSSLLEEGIL